MERLAEQCDEELQKAGFPGADQPMRFNAHGQWCLEAEDEADDPWKTPGFMGAGLGAHFAEQHAKPFSDAWYAAKIGKNVRSILAQRDASYEFHLQRILAIGVLVTEWDWRTAFKPTILTGIRQREALGWQRSRAHEKARAAREARREIIQTLLHRTKREGGALEEYLVRRLREDFGIKVSRRTIRRDLSSVRGPKPKKLGQAR